MTAIEPAGEKIVRNLQEAVERLHEDTARVELWADALGCFTRPVPNYDPAKGKLNKFALTPASSEQRQQAGTRPRSGLRARAEEPAQGAEISSDMD